jgi:hypothetical protein
VAAGRRAAVAGQLDEVDAVDDRRGATQVGEEDEARLQRGDEKGLAAGVIARDLLPELADAVPDLVCGEIDGADPGISVDG